MDREFVEFFFLFFFAIFEIWRYGMHFHCPPGAHANNQKKAKVIVKKNRHHRGCFCDCPVALPVRSFYLGHPLNNVACEGALADSTRKAPQAFFCFHHENVWGRVRIWLRYQLLFGIQHLENKYRYPIHSLGKNSS